jgi:hypothetical protein
MCPNIEQVALRAVVLMPRGPCIRGAALRGGSMDWMVVSTILPQAPGPKARVLYDTGYGLMLSPITTHRHD